MNEKLYATMQAHGDTQQDLAYYLGLRGYQSIYKKLYGKQKWSYEQIQKVCEKYNKTKEELGL